jgi:hypothetical protein
MRAAPVLSAIARGEPMSAIYPPEHQQSSPQPPPEVRPPRRRHRLWIIIGSVLGAAALIGIGAGIGAAAHTTGISQASYKAERAQVTSLRDQVSSLTTQLATASDTLTAAQAKAASAQAVANANAAATYQGKEAALAAQEKIVASEQATLKQELGQVQANTISSDGTFVVGQDIKSGTYHTNGSGNAGANDCYYATLSSTDGSINSIIANGNFDGPETISLDGVYAFQTNGPCTWNLIPGS